LRQANNQSKANTHKNRDLSANAHADSIQWRVSPKHCTNGTPQICLEAGLVQLLAERDVSAPRKPGRGVDRDVELIHQDGLWHILLGVGIEKKVNE
jgi:hypothetical protein